MASGGDQLSGRDREGKSVGVATAVVHGRTQVRGVQFAKVLLDDQQGFPDQRGRVLHDLKALRGRRTEADRRERRLDDVRGAEMRPMLPRNGIVRHHPLPVAR